MSKSATNRKTTTNGKSGYISVDKVPTREDFVDPEERKQIDDLIARGKPLDFMPNSVSESLPFKNYEILLHGTLLSGDKATLIISQVPVFFDLRMPKGKTTLYTSQLKLELTKQECEPCKIEVLEGRYPFEYDIKDTYFRLHFKSIQTRKKAISYFNDNKYKHSYTKNGVKVVEEHKYETALDDMTHYYRKATRESDGKICLIDWLTIKNYTVSKSKTISRATYTINAKYDNIKWNPVDKKISENKKYADEKLVVLSFDIETHTYSADGGVPLPDDANAEMFQAAISCFWRYDKNPFYKVGICTKDMTKRPYDVIKCETEKELIEAIFQVIDRMKPDFIVEFNGGDYDWPWLINRSVKYNLLDYVSKCLCIMRDFPKSAQVKKWNVRKTEIKLDAERQMSCINMRFPGYECIDTRVKFRQMYKTEEESSLKFFLSKCKLPGKDPIDHIQLARRFKNSDMDEEDVESYIKTTNPELTGNELKKACAEFIEKAKVEMGEVMDYCLVDSDRPQLLLLNKNVIPDMREVGIRSYTTMYDGIYIADGMKVTNLIMHCAFKAKLEFSTIVDRSKPIDSDFKYIGAYVVEPETGLENTRPVTGLDFASLYPSLIRTYNFSPECIVNTKERADELEKKGHRLQHIKFPGPGGEDIEGWTVWHDNDPKKTGIYALILGELFDSRKSMKAEIKPFAEKMEHIGREIAIIKEELAKTPSETKQEELTKLSNEYEEVKKIFDYVNAKQKALKVFMNTFYGLMGFNQSPLFKLLLAGGVTTMGQWNIKYVHKFCTDNGYKVKYGDTDSLYISPPDKVYVKEDLLYKSGKITKLEYWTEMVKNTITELNKFKDRVGEHLKANNGTSYLAMAYEEVLFPVVFLAKKMYYGIPHEGVVNFKPPKLFIKGIANIKRGFPQFIKTMIDELQWQSMAVDNELDLKDLVVAKMKELTTRNWKLEDFAQSAEWRPKKAQPTLQTFIARLKPKDRPNPGERVHFLVVDQNPYYTTIDGKKATKKKGEMMELLSTAKEKDLKPNLLFYINGFAGSGGTAVGQFARFIAWHKDFEVKFDENQKHDKVYMKTIDNKRMKNAKNYLKKLCTTLLSGYKFDAKSSKFVYTQVVHAIKELTEETYGDDVNILSKLKDSPIEDFVQSATKDALTISRTKAFKTRAYNSAKAVCNKYTPIKAYDIYAGCKNDYNILRMRNKYIESELKVINAVIATLIPKLTELANQQNKITSDMILKLRKSVGIDSNVSISTYGIEKFKKLLKKETKKIEVPVGHKEDLKKLTMLYDRMIKLKVLAKWNLEIEKYIKFEKISKAGDTDPIDKIEPAKKEDLRKIASTIDIKIF